jgi:SAM-dependent methyltransferase
MRKDSPQSDISKDTRRLYNDLAWTWPIISPPEHYIEESERIKKVIRKFSTIPVKTLLNLGCGGGHVDWVLKKYFTITGVDISDKILQLAQQLNPEVTYLKGDMRHTKLHTKFDAVLIHDSINYMLTEKDLQAAFTTGYNHLQSGGVFVTFAEEHGRIEQNKIHYTICKKGTIEITFIEHYFDPNPKDTTFEGTFIYLIRKNKKLQIHTDRHLCGIFNLKTWRVLLDKVGFTVKRVNNTDAVSDKGKTIPTFVGIKPS